MSGLAQITRAQGNFVAGSDRNYDRQTDKKLFTRLQTRNIILHHQDGSGITPEIDEVIISSAIEDDNPDLSKAKELSLPVTYRSALLARIFNSARGIGVAGSSGKSTITAMAAKLMDDAELNPTVFNGAIIPDYEGSGGVGNAKLGSSNYVLAETDESDGSIVNFYPEISILANISKDHKPVSELKKNFLRFIKNTKKAVIINADCPYSQELIPQVSPDKVISFGFGKESQVKAQAANLSKEGSTFMVRDTLFSLPIAGKHNISNALAVIALGIKLGLSLSAIRDALKMFRGVKRRLELVGTAGNIWVFDDFSHSPAKISTAVETLKQIGNRLILIYQPHGYGPTKFLKKELIETFNANLTSADVLILLDIYYAGGTIDKSICAADLLKEIRIPHAENLKDWKKVITKLKEISKPGDVIVVMGARDNSLSKLARTIADNLNMMLTTKTGA